MNFKKIIEKKSFFLVEKLFSKKKLKKIKHFWKFPKFSIFRFFRKSWFFWKINFFGKNQKINWKFSKKVEFFQKYFFEIVKMKKSRKIIFLMRFFKVHLKIEENRLEPFPERFRQEKGAKSQITIFFKKNLPKTRILLVTLDLTTICRFGTKIRGVF